MTLEELRKFIQPFTDECEVVSQNGKDISLKYVLSTGGEGFIVIREVENDRRPKGAVKGFLEGSTSG